jgi:HK97 family phage major capsid protein
MSTLTLEQQVAELAKSQGTTKEGMDTLIKSFGELKGRLEQPVYPKQYFDDQGRPIGGFEDTDEEISFRLTDTEGYDGAQKRKGYRGIKKSVNNELRKAGYQRWGTFKSFNEFVREGIANKDGSEFKAKLTKHYEPLLKAVQGMSITEGASAGITVMPEFSNKIFDRVYDNDLWGMTDNYTVSGNNMTFLANAETSRATGSSPRRDARLLVAGRWHDHQEQADAAGSRLKLVKLGVVVYLTQELIDDTGIALEQYVARKASEEFNFMIGDSLFNGTGVGQPLGLLNSPSLVSIAKETGQGAATLQAENIVKMYRGSTLQA